MRLRIVITAIIPKGCSFKDVAKSNLSAEWMEWPIPHPGHHVNPIHLNMQKLLFSTSTPIMKRVASAMIQNNNSILLYINLRTHLMFVS